MFNSVTIMSAKSTSDIRDHFNARIKDDPVQNYMLERIRKETDKLDKVEEVVYVDVDVDFFKNKVKELEKENLKLKKDNQDLKKLYNKSNEVNLQKDILIKELKKQINKNNRSILNIPNQTKKSKIIIRTISK